jgi:hypothetical protein
MRHPEHRRTAKKSVCLILQKNLSPGKGPGHPNRIYARSRLWKRTRWPRGLVHLPRTASEGPAAVCFLFDTALFPVFGPAAAFIKGRLPCPNPQKIA